MNYRLTVNQDPICIYDADAVMPAYDVKIHLRLLLDPQHDGHLWSECNILDAEQDVVEEILNDLRKEVVKLVKNAKLFGIHGETHE